MNEHDTIPSRNVRRRREPGLNLPKNMSAGVPGIHVGQRPMTPEEWQADQDHKQRQHAKGFIEARRREIAERKATNEALETAEAKPVGHGIKTASELIDGVKERLLVPEDPGDLPDTPRARRSIKVAPRGPKVDKTTGEMVDEGEVPITRQRTKRISRVAAARKAARLRKVLG